MRLFDTRKNLQAVIDNQKTMIAELAQQNAQLQSDNEWAYAELKKAKASAASYKGKYEKAKGK